MDAIFFWILEDTTELPLTLQVADGIMLILALNPK